MIKAIIFDFDGVIVETDSFNYEIFKRLFEKNGIEFDKGIYINQFIGRPLKECIPDYLKKFNREIESEYFISEKKRMFDNVYSSKVTFFKDAEILINRLYKKYKLAIASGTRRSLMNKALRKFKLKEYFEIILTSEDFDQGKPHPEIYLKAFKFLNVKPNESVIIEDTPIGIEAAKKAGAICIAVTHTHSKKELKKANRVITSLDYLIL